jgi:hypothetical protein
MSAPLSPKSLRSLGREQWYPLFGGTISGYALLADDDDTKPGSLCTLEASTGASDHDEISFFKVHISLVNEGKRRRSLRIL